jgi:diaminohydroxyphosphoribosylaminopyrimidine deaminase / 5-amino-6-(5-phosphoribosylamino)uracil reductase
MQAALRLAWRGRGCVEPNPMVGCIIMRNGKLLGEGWHKKHGGPHAEIEALNDCKRKGHVVKGADVYVTLEPCCHHGKTPPCTDALIDAKVARVFIAMADPFDKVHGQGIAKLKKANIETRVGLGNAIASEQNKAFIKRVTTGLPWVATKWAQTVDGKIATACGDSKWISNSFSRKQVHKWRSRMDAIIVGIGTVLADDPMLTARGVHVRRHAIRIVIDSRLQMPIHSKLVQSASNSSDAPPVFIATSSQARQDKSEHAEALISHQIKLIEVPPIADKPSHLDLRWLLQYLVNEHTTTNVLIEGGGRLNGSLFQQKLVDQAVVFQAPKLLGDSSSIPAVAGMTASTITDGQHLNLHRVKRLRDDVVLDYRTNCE